MGTPPLGSLNHPENPKPDLIGTGKVPTLALYTRVRVASLAGIIVPPWGLKVTVKLAATCLTTILIGAKSGMYTITEPSL